MVEFRVPRSLHRSSSVQFWQNYGRFSTKMCPKTSKRPTSSSLTGCRAWQRKSSTIKTTSSLTLLPRSTEMISRYPIGPMSKWSLTITISLLNVSLKWQKRTIKWRNLSQLLMGRVRLTQLLPREDRVDSRAQRNDSLDGQALAQPLGRIRIVSWRITEPGTQSPRNSTHLLKLRTWN